MRSEAVSVDAYLAGLPADRREVVAEVLETVRRHLPSDTPKRWPGG